MKTKAFCAIALLVLLSGLVVGQTKRSTKSPARNTGPSGWKVDGKTVWEFADVWQKGTENPREMVCAILPATFLKIPESKPGDSLVTVDLKFNVETDTVQVKGDTITWRDILINGRPAEVRYRSGYSWEYEVEPFTRRAEKVVGFKRRPPEKTGDFVLIGEGYVAEGGWNDRGSDRNGSTLTNYMVQNFTYYVVNIYVFEKSTKEPVYRYNYREDSEWVREQK